MGSLHKHYPLKIVSTSLVFTLVTGVFVPEYCWDSSCHGRGLTIMRDVLIVLAPLGDLRARRSERGEGRVGRGEGRCAMH